MKNERLPSSDFSWLECIIERRHNPLIRALSGNFDNGSTDEGERLCKGMKKYVISGL
jgi:hypothetical protein